VDWPLAGPARLEWVQVEVTTRCQASCRYCPRRAYADRWREGDLDPGLLERLLPQLPHGTVVHLQGWGEPLLHPRLVELAGRIRTAGLVPTTTTNGLALDTEVTLRLAEAGLEILGISMTGVDAEHNDRWRCGTEAAGILRAAERTAEIVALRGLPGPRLHAAHLLLRSGVPHLPEAVGRLASAGFERIVVSSLDLVPERELVRETLWDLGDVAAQELRDTVEAAMDRARQAGVSLVVQLATARRRGRCPERPGHSVFIGFDGSVFPCVDTGVPIERAGWHWTPEGCHEIGRFPLGNIADGDLKSIRLGRAFRRMARSDRGPLWVTARCRNCAKPFVERPGTVSDEALLVPELG